MNYSIKTDRGKRKDNQDSTATFFNQSNILLAILCDGIGCENINENVGYDVRITNIENTVDDGSDKIRSF